MTASGSVDDYKDTSSLQTAIAANAGVDSLTITSITVEAASVIVKATIEVDDTAAADAVQSSLDTNLGTAATASAALGITVELDPSSEKKEVSGGSVSAKTQATTAVMEVAVPVTAPGTTSDTAPFNAPVIDQAADQTVQDDEVPIGMIVAIVVLFAILCFLPLACFLYAHNKFGPGKTADFLSYKCSHSNASIPFFYTPADQRESKRCQLYSKQQILSNIEEPEEVEAPSTYYQEAPDAPKAPKAPKASDPSSPPGETAIERKMRLHFEKNASGPAPYQI